MKLVPNTDDDPFTAYYIKEGWSSLGFDYLSNYDSDVEDRSDFGNIRA